MLWLQAKRRLNQPGGGSFDYLSQSCAGVLAATLGELWVVARAISARVGGDPGFRGLSGPLNPPLARQPRTLAMLHTAGLSSATPDGVRIFAELQNRIESAGVRLLTRDTTSAVARVEDAIRDAGNLSRKINAWESRWPLNTYARDLDVEGLSPTMRARLKEAERMTLEEYQNLLSERLCCRDVYAELASASEACITLSAPGPAPIGLASTGDPTFAIPGSLLGIPAISMPLFQIDGLPLGLQILGFSGRDADLFGVCAAVQIGLT